MLNIATPSAPTGSFKPVVRISISFLTAAALTLRPTGAFAQSPKAATARAPRYDGVVRLDPSNGALEGRWTLQLAGHDADSLILLLNPGLRHVRVTGPQVIASSLDSTRGLQRVRIALRSSRQSRDVRVEVAVRGTLQVSSEGINTVTAAYSELGLDSFWFPVLDGFPDLTGTLRLTLPADLRLATSGHVKPGPRERNGWRTHLIENTVPLPDFAFVAARTLTPQSVGGAQAVTTTADSALVRAMLDVTAECTQYLVSRYGGAEPMPTVQIVLPPRSGPGYARKHYIVVPVGEWRGTREAASTRARAQTSFVCHEVAHYWSSGAAATGPENWINEGFAEFVSARAVRELRGDSAYAVIEAKWRARADKAGAVWTASATARPDANASYGKAPLLLAALEARVGIERMDRILREFMTRPVRTTPAVLQLIAEQAGSDVAAWFERQLGAAP